jgi:2-polyprenyl-3-methyl-5-hydroxy-6-metoxy-1,4-benzoquinol methylase
VDRIAPHGRILDVGVGEGVLLHHLRNASVQTVVGVDLSSEALTRARVRTEDPRCHFAVADAARLPFAPRPAFDVAVVAETLYYVEDPVAVFRQLRTLVGCDGSIVVSMYESGASNRIWELLDAEATDVIGVDLRNTAGVGWRVRCYSFAASGSHHRTVAVLLAQASVQAAALGQEILDVLGGDWPT